MLTVILVNVFLSGFYMICFLGSCRRMEKPSIARLMEYFETGTTPRKTMKTKSDVHRALGRIGDRLSGVIFLKGYRIYLERELERADLPIKAEELLVIHTALFLLGCLYYPISCDTILSASFATLLSILPLLIISSKKKKRIKAFNQQLGDGIMVISNSLRAGYSFMQAVEMVAREMPDPISTEFHKMLREMNLGMSTESAMNNLVKRLPSQDLEMMVMAVMIQRQVGGNLAEILDNISLTIRERIKIKGEIRTLTAQGKMSGLVISFLPMFLALALFVLNPSYINKLFITPVGLVMLVVGVIMQIIGFFLIRMIVNVEV